MTDNPNRIPFFALPREDQDRIAGAIARGEPVEFWTDVLGGEWREKDGKEIMLDRILRIPPTPKPAKLIASCDVGVCDQVVWTGGMPPNLQIIRAPKPAKDPNRPRPAHKLKLQKGDVVMHIGYQDVSMKFDLVVTVGSGNQSDWLRSHIDKPLPKGQRPLFIVVSRAKDTAP